jgi:hypothetical protein
VDNLLFNRLAHKNADRFVHFLDNDNHMRPLKYRIARITH